MKDRIRQLMESQNMTQKTFADFTGLSAATLCGIFNNRTKPTLNIVEAIRTKFPNINIDWLMFGNGTMFNAEATDSTSSSTPQGNAAGEQSLLFDDDVTVNNVLSQAAVPTSNTYPTEPVKNAVAKTGKQGFNANIVYSDTVRRRITEIRVFFDDQTYESFVPKK